LLNISSVIPDIKTAAKASVLFFYHTSDVQIKLANWRMLSSRDKILSERYHYNFYKLQKWIRRRRTILVIVGASQQEGELKMAQVNKLARILAVIIGVIVIILSFVKVFPLGNEGLVVAAFLTCWGLDSLI
jgi:hypothetical protein